MDQIVRAGQGRNMSREDDKQSISSEDELRRLSEKGITVGDEWTTAGRIDVEAGQRLADLSSRMLEVVNNLPEGTVLPFVENYIADIGEYIKIGEEQIILSSFDNSMFASTSSNTYVSASGFVAQISPPLPIENYPDLIIAKRDVIEFTQGTADVSAVRELMLDLQLDKSIVEGKQTPLELFDIAINAYYMPVSKEPVPAVSSLIPMRGSVDNSVDFLLRLRPNQTNITKSQGQNIQEAKIIEIGHQLRKDQFRVDLFVELGQKWVRMKQYDLSPGKDDTLTREEWGRRLFGTVHFLNSFLERIDPNKYG